MSWKDRLKEAAFTSPGGTRTVFFFDSKDLRADINKRDVTREFPDFEGALVQSFGIGASSYPLRVFFWGDDHDLAATAFLGLLSETGTGVLEHPFYGRLENIVAFGNIRRRDDLKTAANQTVFEINFVQSAAFSFPTPFNAISDTINADIKTFSTDQADSFANNIKTVTAREKTGLQDAVKGQTSIVKSALKKVAGTVAEIEKQFNDTYDLIQNNISSLIGQPLALAGRMIDLVQYPAQAAAGIISTLSAYRDLLNTTISQADSLFKPAINNSVNNQFLNAELNATTTLSAMILSANKIAIATSDATGFSLEEFVSTDPADGPAFTTKAEILSAIDFLSASFDSLTVWREANRASLGLLDTGDFYSSLKNAYNLLAGFLVRVSFSARREIELVLSAPRSFIELCAELYGVLDNAFDFFVLTNDFTGDELLEIPRGRKVIYYV